MPISSLIPHPSSILLSPPIKADPNYLPIYRIEYQFKTELDGWSVGRPFVLSYPARKKLNTGTVLAIAAADHPDAIGIEITAIKLSTPLTNVPD